MKKLTKIVLAMALLVTFVIPTTLTYACDTLCPNVTKTKAEICPYCSVYTPCCKAWSKCKNPEKVIGIYKWNRTKDIGELPMCTVLHKKEKDYKKISIINDTDQIIKVRVYYSLIPFGWHDHTRRELAPGETYDFKYDKHVVVWSKYLEVNGHRHKVNHEQSIKLSEVN